MSTINSIGSTPVISVPSSATPAVTEQVYDTVSSLFPQDVTNVPLASQLQSNTSTAKAAQSGVALTGSQVQTLDQSITQTLDLVNQAEQLTAQANSASTPEQLQTLEAKLTGVIEQLNRIPASFNGVPLTDGSFSTSIGQALGGTASGPSLQVPDITAQGLLGGTTPDISTPEGAQNAQQIFQSAIGVLNVVQSDANNFSQALNVAGATAASIVNNYNAATSTLDENYATQVPQPLDAQQAVLAQGITPALLDLINQPPA